MLVFKILFTFSSLGYVVLNAICATTSNPSQNEITIFESSKAPKKLSKQGKKIEIQSHKEAHNQYYRDQSPHARRISNLSETAREAIRAQGIHQAHKEDAEYRMEEFANRPKSVVHAQRKRKDQAIVAKGKESEKENDVIRDTDYHVANGGLTHEDRQKIHKDIRVARKFASLE